MEDTIAGINDLEPDVVVVAGDLTANAYDDEFEEAARWLDQIEGPKLTVMGNHDAKNVGHVLFERHFGTRYPVVHIPFDDERSARIEATGVTLVGVDSTEPDVTEGRVGSDRFGWMAEQFARESDINVFVLHHHLVPLPGTGRERNTAIDAGDVLALLTRLDVDIVLAGHKHTPWFWSLNGVLFSNSATASTGRLRGLTPASWHELRVDAAMIKVFTHYPGEGRDLSLIVDRTNRDRSQRMFYITDSFLSHNQLEAI